MKTKGQIVKPYDESTLEILLQILLFGIVSIGGILLLTWILACLGVRPTSGGLPWSW